MSSSNPVQVESFIDAAPGDEFRAVSVRIGHERVDLTLDESLTLMGDLAAATRETYPRTEPRCNTP